MSKYTAFPRMTPFNRDDIFIFRRKVRVHGQWYDDKDKVPKEYFTTRRLRQMYEQRIIQAIIVPIEEKDASERPDFKQLPTVAIKDFLKTNGCVARRGWLREKLIAKAEQIWDAKNGKPVTEPDTERDQQGTGSATVDGNAT